jgi:hypothetical protein
LKKYVINSGIAVAAVALIFACATPQKYDASKISANVTMFKALEGGLARYRVNGAVGADKGEALKTARVAALRFAARSLTGDPAQKTAARQYIEQNMTDVMNFANAGKIFKTGMNDDGTQMKLDMFVDVQTRELATQLSEQGIISSASDLAKSAGKPKFMVVYGGDSCEGSRSGLKVCTLPKQIKQKADDIIKAERKPRELMATMVNQGCLAPTVLKEQSKAYAKFSDTSSRNSESSSDRSARSSRSNDSSRSSRDGSSGRSSSSDRSGGSSSNSRSDSLDVDRGMGQGSASSSRNNSRNFKNDKNSSRNFKNDRSSSAANRSRADSESSASSSNKSNRQKNVQSDKGSESSRSLTKASDNCKAFLRELRPLERKVMQLVYEKERLQRQLYAIRNEEAKKDIARNYLTDELMSRQFDIVTEDGAREAQGRLDAMGAVKGLPADPVAQIAALADANIFIKYTITETPAPNYTVKTDVSVYETATAKKLAGATKITREARSSSGAARTKGVRDTAKNAMKQALEQMTGYWANYAKEGIPHRVVLGSVEGFTPKEKMRITEMFDELPKKLVVGDDYWNPGNSTENTIKGDLMVSPKGRKRIGLKIQVELDEWYVVRERASNQAVTVLDLERK